MAFTFNDLGSSEGLKKLDDYLLTRNFITGYHASKDDLTVYAALPKAPSAEYVNASRWYTHIDALLRISGLSPEGSGFTVEGFAPLKEEATSTPPVADSRVTFKKYAGQCKHEFRIGGNDSEENHGNNDSPFITKQDMLQAMSNFFLSEQFVGMVTGVVNSIHGARKQNEKEDDKMPSLESVRAPSEVNAIVKAEFEAKIEARLEKHEKAQQAMLDKMMELLHVKELSYAKPRELIANGLERFPQGFSMPRFRIYNGKGCPMSHVNHFVIVLTMVGLSENQIAMLFPTTLEGEATNWYNQQPNEVKKDLVALLEAFVNNYAYNTLEFKTTLQDLEAVRQKQGESFQDYYVRWIKVMNGLTAKPSVPDLIVKLVDGSLYKKEMKYNTCNDFVELLEMGKRVERYLGNST